MDELEYRFNEAVEHLRRYGGLPDERTITLLELLGDLNDDLQHMRDVDDIRKRFVAAVNAIDTR